MGSRSFSPRITGFRSHAVNLWYHVGPANEEPGRTGFAHLFEHMMFQGSKDVKANEHFRYLEGAGASTINGTTDFDRTNYFETVPSNQLELALWLESDRMGYLIDKLDQTNLSTQQDVGAQRAETEPRRISRMESWKRPCITSSFRRLTHTTPR